MAVRRRRAHDVDERSSSPRERKLCATAAFVRVDAKYGGKKLQMEEEAEKWERETRSKKKSETWRRAISHGAKNCLLNIFYVASCACELFLLTIRRLPFRLPTCGAQRPPLYAASSRSYRRLSSSAFFSHSVLTLSLPHSTPAAYNRSATMTLRPQTFFLTFATSATLMPGFLRRARFSLQAAASRNVQMIAHRRLSLTASTRRRRSWRASARSDLFLSSSRPWPFFLLLLLTRGARRR